MSFLKLMYITNRTDIAALADRCGVDRIFVDLEVIGKAARQENMNTVISDHSVADIGAIKKVVKNAEVLVRVNSIYHRSKEEIDACVAQKADIIMLPYFKTTDEVKTFLDYVGGRAKTCLLVETKEAVEIIDDILKIPGIDMIHIGLNDLHLSYGNDFMFEPLCNGTVEKIISKIKAAGIPYGFGGIARIGKGLVPAEHIIAEHKRLGSSMAILSRSFCDANLAGSIEEISDDFESGIREIRSYEDYLMSCSDSFFETNRKQTEYIVNSIVKKTKKNSLFHIKFKNLL